MKLFTRRNKYITLHTLQGMCYGTFLFSMPITTALRYLASRMESTSRETLLGLKNPPASHTKHKENTCPPPVTNVSTQAVCAFMTIDRDTNDTLMPLLYIALFIGAGFGALAGLLYGFASTAHMVDTSSEQTPLTAASSAPSYGAVDKTNTQDIILDQDPETPAEHDSLSITV